MEVAPLDELVDVIRPAGLANQKAARIKASLAKLREDALGRSGVESKRQEELEDLEKSMGIRE